MENRAKREWKQRLRASATALAVFLLAVYAVQFYRFHIGFPLEKLLEIDAPVESAYVWHWGETVQSFEQPLADEVVEELKAFRYHSVLKPGPRAGGDDYILCFVYGQDRESGYKIAPGMVQIGDTWYIGNEGYLAGLLPDDERWQGMGIHKAFAESASIDK